MAWFSPYILADGQVDTRSLDTVLAAPRFAGKHGEDLAVALWTWLVDKREGFYHFLAGTEEPGQTLTADSVKDPLRLLNTYGYGLCGNVAMLYAALFDWAGQKCRVVGIPGHTISEAYWGGAWHLMDCDLRALHYKKTDQGCEIASLHELVTNPDLVANPVRKSDPYYMSDEHARDIAKGCYQPGQERYLPHYFYRLGSMDYVLRPGESLTCYYQPQGRFYWGKDWSQWIKGDQLKSFTGPADKKDPNRRYAAACIRWKPNLQADLDEIGVSSAGFDLAPVGLTARAAAATLRYRLVSPYMICGRYEAFDPARKRIDALLVRLNASASPTLTITTPRDGRTSRVPLQQEGDEFLADLTEYADLHYEYELAISLPTGQTLRAVAIETWCQASAMTLPQWCQPGRQVRLATGSAWRNLQGRAVLPCLVDLIQRLQDGSNLHPQAMAMPSSTQAVAAQPGATPSSRLTSPGMQEDRAREVGVLVSAVTETYSSPLLYARLDSGYLNDSTTLKLLPRDGKVCAVAAIEPPLPGRIVRLHAMAGVAAAKDAADASGEVTLEFAPHPDGPWKTLDCRPVAVDPQEFHFSVEGWHSLAEPLRRVWLRLCSPRPVGVWRVRLDYEPAELSHAAASDAEHPASASPPAASGHQPLDLLLRWRQDGKLRMHTQRFLAEDLGKPFVPLTESGMIQPLHLVLSVPSRGWRPQSTGAASG